MSRADSASLVVITGSLSLECSQRRARLQGSRTLNGEIKKMRGAGDAGVVVTDHRLGAKAEGVIRLVEAEGVKTAVQVLIDPRLVLAGGWHDARGADDAVRVHRIPVPEQAARGLGRAKACSRARSDLGLLVGQPRPYGPRRPILSPACRAASPDVTRPPREGYASEARPRRHPRQWRSAPRPRRAGRAC